MSDFDPAIAFVLENEGGLEENAKDPGGITNFGISLRFLRTIPQETLKTYQIFDFPVDSDTIRRLTLPQVKAIYKGEFWDRAPFERILNQIHCNYIFDMAVNLGIAPAIKCVQRALWAVLHDWEKIPEDGILGDQTLTLIKQCGFLIMPAIRAERGSYYRMIANQNPQEKEFLNDWYNRTYHTA
jgi:lysozyme family protein